MPGIQQCNSSENSPPLITCIFKKYFVKIHFISNFILNLIEKCYYFTPNRHTD